MLSQMFAQQLASNQSYQGEEGRTGPKPPSRVVFEGSRLQEGQNVDGHGTRGRPGGQARAYVDEMAAFDPQEFCTYMD